VTGRPVVQRERPEGEYMSQLIFLATSDDLDASAWAQCREQYIVETNGGSEGVLIVALSGESTLSLEFLLDSRDMTPPSAVFDRVRGCIFEAALLLAAATASRLVDDGPRRRGGRVTFCPFAVRVVTVPSGFLT
jgi:hypothetical protein